MGGKRTRRPPTKPPYELGLPSKIMERIEKKMQELHTPKLPKLRVVQRKDPLKEEAAAVADELQKVWKHYRELVERREDLIADQLLEGMSAGAVAKFWSTQSGYIHLVAAKKGVPANKSFVRAPGSRQDRIAFVKENMDKMTAKEMALKLGVTAACVRVLMRLEGWSGKKGGQK